MLSSAQYNTRLSHAQNIPQVDGEELVEVLRLKGYKETVGG